jgi:hypothetical protein
VLKFSVLFGNGARGYYALLLQQMRFFFARDPTSGLPYGRMVVEKEKWNVTSRLAAA